MKKKNEIQATKIECRRKGKNGEKPFDFLHKQICEMKKNQVNSQHHPLEILWTK